MKIKLLALAIFAISCTQGSEQASVDDAAADEQQKVSIIIWSEVGLRETPNEKGNYVTSAYIGEHVTITGDTASEVSGSKKHHYHKITLSDGKTGWVRDEFIAIDVVPAAVIANEAQVLKRPDLSTVTDKAFLLGDFVAVKKKDGEYVEVIGKIRDDKWFTTGYVREETVSYLDIEVQFAALNQRAAEETKDNVRTALYAQLGNPDLFRESYLFSVVYGEPTGEDGGEEFSEGDGDGDDAANLDPPTEGLVGYYPLNNLDATDYGPNQNDGTKFNVGVAVDKQGFAEGAMSFDGTSFISLANNSGVLQPPFSVVATFALTDLTTLEQCVVSRGRSADGTGFSFGYTVKPDGTPIFYLGMVGEKPVGVEATANVKQGEWVYLAATYDSKFAKLYINGELTSSKPISPTDAEIISRNLANSAEPIEIGRELANLDRYFHGSIDNVAIWNRALTEQEIAAMHN